MANSSYGAPGGEMNSQEGSPNPSSRGAAHPDSAHGQDPDVLFDPDAASRGERREELVAEDSIRGAFPPEEDNSPDDSTGPAWAEEAEEKVTNQEKKGKKTSAGGGVLGDVKSFLLDDKEQRAERKARKAAAAAGVDAPSGITKGSSRNGSATSVAAPTKVSRRARLLGGKRGRATLLMSLVIITALLAVVNLGLVLTRPSQADIDERVATAMREQGQDFPRGQAVAWADQLVIDWGTWDEDNAEEREVRMAQYLTSGMDSQAGWNGKGTQQVTFTSANPEPTVLDENRALVNVDYRLDDGSRRCVSVPVYAYLPEGLTGENVQYAFGLSSNPIPRPCAPRTGAMEDPAVEEAEETLAPNDELARELTSSFFPGFFSAWAASDANSLRQYSASGVTTIGLGGAMSSTPPPSIQDVVIRTPRNGEPEEGSVYVATVPVTWTVAGSSAQITASYDVPMKMVGDRWYVAGEPTPSTSSPDAQSGSPADKVDPEAGTESDEQAEEPTPGPSDAGGGE